MVSYLKTAVKSTFTFLRAFLGIPLEIVAILPRINQYFLRLTTDFLWIQVFLDKLIFLHSLIIMYCLGDWLEFSDELILSKLMKIIFYRQARSRKVDWTNYPCIEIWCHFGCNKCSRKRLWCWMLGNSGFIFWKRQSDALIVSVRK